MRFETYCEETVVDRTVIDGFIAGTTPMMFDSELGYIQRDVVWPGSGIDASATLSNFQPNGARRSFLHNDKVPRINTYGDSFTNGAQVNDGETWQEYLAGHLGEPIRNYGVGSYGVYQAYRRMLREERNGNGAEYLILTIACDDSIRSLARYRRAMFHRMFDEQGGRLFHGNCWPNVEMDLASGRFVERENPLSTPESLYSLTDRRWLSEYLDGDLALQLMAFGFDFTDALDRRRIDLLAEHLAFPLDWADEKTLQQQALALLDRYGSRATIYTLGRAREFARQHHKKLFVILNDPFRALAELHAGGTRYDQLVVDYLVEERFDYFDMNTCHLRDLQTTGLDFMSYIGRYLVAGSGHYNPAGNHLFAYAMKRAIVDWLDPKPIPYRGETVPTVDFGEYLDTRGTR